MIGVDDTPPTYEEALGILPKYSVCTITHEDQTLSSSRYYSIDQEPRSTRPPIQSTGPTWYKGDSCLLSVVCLFMVAEFGTKLLISGLYFSNAQYPDKNNKFCISFTIIAAINSLNFWPIGYLFYSRHRTLERFSLREGWWNKGFLFLLLDSTILVLLIAVSVFTYNPKLSVVVTFLSTLTLLGNYGIQHILKTNEVISYDPCSYSCNYSYIRRYEQFFLPQRQVSIEESSPFRIVINNCGQNYFNNLTISRRISVFRLNGTVRENGGAGVHISINLSQTLTPGDTLIIVPETHHMIGSYKIHGLRSFGAERGAAVVTEVRDELERCLVRLVEEFDENL